MKIQATFIQAAAVAALVALLSGCGETTTDTVKQWQAAGNISKLVGATDASSDQDIRLAATEALGALKAEEAIEPLGALIVDQDLGVALNAIRALAQYNSPAAQKHLLSVLEAGTPRGRAIAAEALGECPLPEAVDPLIKMLDDEYEPAVLGAAVSLGKIGNAKAVEPLSAKVQSMSQPLRLACVQSLSSIGGETAIPGLALALGDISDDVRNPAVATLVALGPASIPIAQEALRSTDEKVRQSGMAILEGVNQIPSSGDGFVWYQLGKTQMDKKKILINTAVIEQLASQGGNAVDALLEAAAHPNAAVREHALQALEQIGEPGANKAAEAAETQAGPEAKRWFAGRGNWRGAPSWRLDLWGGVVALNPNFELNPAKTAQLEEMDSDARRVMANSQFMPTREYIPLLVSQLSYTETSGTSNPHMAEHLKLATKQLKRLDRKAELPLIAAVSDPDPQTAGNAAEILMAMGSPNAEPVIIDAFSKQLEAGAPLGDTPFYRALQKIDNPATEPLLIMAYPNAERALQVFKRKYPGARASIMPSQSVYEGDDKPLAFQVGYYSGKHIKEMKVTFRKHKNGEWKPFPALPDALPE
ncbi:HEAT repeat domain-containing protein [Pontiella sulfatireligans]|uniref:HEAT repeat domain-containing protein n=1 Tax=Pontiella sulfatireligans TaxID=2750658 RepID=A0A6C2UJG5_9BACT|nr:HEAT repeat domain-containing protein [Pontiella sulfatireligans]VGO20365.1 hypothetical protein SCARR_02428 [Pontiella sulfatireligans]